MSLLHSTNTFRRFRTYCFNLHTWKIMQSWQYFGTLKHFPLKRLLFVSGLNFFDFNFFFFIWKTVPQAFFSRLSLTLKLNFKLNVYEKALIFVTTVETSFPKCFRINNVRKKVNGFPFVLFCFFVFFQRPEYWKLKISIPLYDFWLTFPKTTCQN